VCGRVEVAAGGQLNCPVWPDQLITTRSVLDLHMVPTTGSTFHGDLFSRVIRWRTNAMHGRYQPAAWTWILCRASLGTS
jgi:hypothetical protein